MGNFGDNSRRYVVLTSAGRKPIKIVLPTGWTHNHTTAMTACASLLSSVLFCLILFSFGGQADGESTFLTVEVTSFVPSADCSPSKGCESFSAGLITLIIISKVITMHIDQY